MTETAPPPPLPSPVELYNPRGLPLEFESEHSFGYDVVKANQLLDLVEKGFSLAEIEAVFDDGIPAPHVIRWTRLSRDFAAEYELSRGIQADILVDKIIMEGQKSNNAGLVKARTDNIKAVAGYFNERYAPKTRTELTGKDGGPVSTVNAHLEVDQNTYSSKEEYDLAMRGYMTDIGLIPLVPADDDPAS